MMTTFLIIFVLSYLYHGLGITVGYHRLLSHRGFKCPLWLEYFIVSGGYLAFEGSPIAWVSTHRAHHRYADKPGDPHRPADGFWHAFAGWLYHPIVVIPKAEMEQICPDLCRDKLYTFLDMGYTKKHALLCGIACTIFRLTILFTLGPWALFANILGSLTPFIGAFLVNSVCHLQSMGYRNFEVEDGSRNVWWVGLVALGEGWHNNHHAIPQSARHGLRPEEFDISWLYIATLQKLGLATDIRLPKPAKLAPLMVAEHIGSDNNSAESTSSNSAWIPGEWQEQPASAVESSSAASTGEDTRLSIAAAATPELTGQRR